MRRWIVAPFLLMTVIGKALADPSNMPQTGVYAVDSIEAVEANPMADSMLPEIEASMERAWIRFDRESRTAEIYMEAQEEPLHYDFDFEAQQATSPDNPTAGLRLETPEQFVMIHGVPFDVAFTFQQIDEEGPEFAALQSARDEWLGAKQAPADGQAVNLTKLFDVEPLSPDSAELLDWDLPYVFDMPADWEVMNVTFNNPELTAAEGLLLSTHFGAPGLVVGRLFTDPDTIRKKSMLSDYTEETIQLENPERSLTLLMDNDGNVGLMGFVEGDQGEMSFWGVDAKDALEQGDIQAVIAMFYTIRMRDS